MAFHRCKNCNKINCAVYVVGCRGIIIYLCSENSETYQLHNKSVRLERVFVFAYVKDRFRHDAAHMPLTLTHSFIFSALLTTLRCEYTVNLMTSRD